MVEFLVESDAGLATGDRIARSEIHVPAHFDAEVLSALGRLHRAGSLNADQVARKLSHLAASPLSRHSLSLLVEEAWRRRNSFRLVDGIYVALADKLVVPLLTADRSLARAFEGAEYVGAST
ncbi:MAG TPA: type II toxin-antitoxin system VapC family toxin [Acidimicrobiia bacterium]